MPKTITLLKSFIIVFALSNSFIYAQDAEDIINAFEGYTEAPRELVYAHLNKSTYIEGEMMGFTTYVFDKFSKSPSQITENLYCVISDSNGNVIKQKLLRVKNGVASNVFDIDSTLSTGVFTFKAYTNWMRNFKENNHYQQTFKVIDASNLEQIKPLKPEDFKVDLQLLGEGGHIIYNVPNTLGIIAKNQFEQGLKNLKGQILTDNNEVLSEFQLNNVGIAKTVFMPEPGKKYYAKINLNGQDIQKEITGIQNSGIALTLADLNSKVIIKLQGSQLFLNQKKDISFKIGLHNGNEMKISEFKLDKEGKIILSYSKEKLFTGINIFTIFTEENKPLLERLYFNHNGIDILDVDKIATKKIGDSIKVTVDLKTLTTTKWSNLSVSVVPEGSKSYNHNNSLLSQLFIQPYVNGTIENGAQYFTKNSEASYNMDLLLLTQGWSSYDWNTIFNYNDVFIYPFERGIDIVSTVNGQNAGTYVVYPINESSTEIYDLKVKEKEFTIKNRFPTKDDLFRVGYIDTKKKGFSKKPSLYMQYFPSAFPHFNQTYSIPVETFESKITSLNEVTLDNSWQKGELLDEIVLTTNKVFTRAEELKDKAINSRVAIIDEYTKKRGMRVDLYLQRLGYTTYFDYFTGNLSITNPRVKWGDPVPLIYLNDMLLTTLGVNSDFSLLTFVDMGDIDYIEWEPYGVGGGVRGQAGFIKIYTAKDFRAKKKQNNVQSYEVPLKFSKAKKFYTSKYKVYNSTFFNEYGTISWTPNISLKDDGSFEIKVLDINNSLKLYIEGVVNDSQYISQELLIEQ